MKRFVRYVSLLLCSLVLVFATLALAEDEVFYPSNCVETVTYKALNNHAALRGNTDRLFYKYLDDEYIVSLSGYSDACRSFLRMIQFFAGDLIYCDGYYAAVNYDYRSVLREREVGRSLELPDFDIDVTFRSTDYCFGAETPIDRMTGVVRSNGSAGTFTFSYGGEMELRFDVYNNKSDTYCALIVPYGSSASQYHVIVCLFGNSSVSMAQKIVSGSKLPARFYSANPTWAKLTSGADGQLIAGKSSAKYIVGKKNAAKYTY